LANFELTTDFTDFTDSKNPRNPCNPRLTQSFRICYLLAILLICMPNLSAQNRTLVATDPLIYEVSYVEVMPASRAAAVASLRQYAEASRKEDGNASCDLLEQIGRSGHFVMLEKWADQKRFDAHAGAESTKQLLTKINPIRLGLDQHTYRTLAVAAAPPANDRAIIVVSHVDTAGNLDAPTLLRQLAEKSRKEKGNVRFDVLQNEMRLNHFTIVEIWETQEALDAHAVAAQTREYRDTIQPVLGSPLDERLFKLLK
jgi:quinol monooxygenase YgiN